MRTNYTAQINKEHKLERQAAKGDMLAKMKLEWLKESRMDVTSQLEDELEFLRSKRNKDANTAPKT